MLQPLLTHFVHFLDANVTHSTINRSDHQETHRMSGERWTQILCAISRTGFFPSLRICSGDEILCSGALHQIATGRVCNNVIEQSVPRRCIRNWCVHTSSVPLTCRWRREALAVGVPTRLTNDGETALRIKSCVEDGSPKDPKGGHMSMPHHLGLSSYAYAGPHISWQFPTRIFYHIWLFMCHDFIRTCKYNL